MSNPFFMFLHCNKTKSSAGKTISVPRLNCQLFLKGFVADDGDAYSSVACCLYKRELLIVVLAHSHLEFRIVAIEKEIKSNFTVDKFSIMSYHD